MKQFFRRLFLCHIMGAHEWTCKASQGIKATDEQVKTGYAGFKEYAKMYCKHCGKPSKLNNRL